jgi:hypothetical protein
MEYFLCISFIGTLVLLAAHAVDYAVDASRRPAAPVLLVMPDEDWPIGEASVPHELVKKYNRAA